MTKILAINPGAASTKIALYNGEDEVFSENIRYADEDVDAYENCLDQRAMRMESLEKSLAGRVELADMDAFSGRGGPIRPLPGGVYRMNDALEDEITSRAVVNHPSLLGGLMARDLAEKTGAPAFIVDPVSVDELADLSRISGLKDFPRKSLGHFLNKRAAARKYAADAGREYESLNLIVIHLGSGITMSAHLAGRMVDTLDSNGEGPFSTERSGCIRVDDLAGYAVSSGLSAGDLKKKLTRGAGLMDHLGTRDAIEIEKRIEAGDEKAALVYEAMTYGVAKHAASLAPALGGKVDAIIVTGDLARSEMLIRWLDERLGWLAPVTVYAGQFEMWALAAGARDVIEGKQRARIFPSCEFEK